MKFLKLCRPKSRFLFFEKRVLSNVDDIQGINAISEEQQTLEKFLHEFEEIAENIIGTDQKILDLTQSANAFINALKNLGVEINNEEAQLEQLRQERLFFALRISFKHATDLVIQLSQESNQIDVQQSPETLRNNLENVLNDLTLACSNDNKHREQILVKLVQLLKFINSKITQISLHSLQDSIRRIFRVLKRLAAIGISSDGGVNTKKLKSHLQATVQNIMYSAFAELEYNIGSWGCRESEKEQFFISQKNTKIKSLLELLEEANHKGFLAKDCYMDLKQAFAYHQSKAREKIHEKSEITEQNIDAEIQKLKEFICDCEQMIS